MLQITNRVSFTLSGYGVDSDGNLYIGKEHWVERIDSADSQGEKITDYYRSYYFTIGSEDTIFLTTGSNVYEMDLSGVVLCETSDPEYKLYDQLKRFPKTQYIGADGNQYQVTYNLGRYQITSGDTLVYEMPASDYCAMIVYFASMLLFFLSVVFLCVRRLRKSIK